MKITYDIIEENFRIFEEARSKFPIIQKYIDGEVTSNALNSVGLHQFGRFHDYVNHNKSMGFDPIMKGMTWRKLKPVLLANTTIERFKIYLRNRTQNEFIDILKNIEVYDRLLKGRWIRKPARRSSGRRSDEKVSSFTSCQIHIINYIIQNEIEISDNILGLEWFLTTKLSLSNTQVREMEVTENLLNSFVGVVEESKVDFKKLNLEYISNFIGEKLKKLMFVEKGSVVKCIKDYTACLTEGKSYTVESSHVRNGYLYLQLSDDKGYMNSYPFSYFEDMSYHRNSILDSLFNDN
jgi:hypothetical protein